jgi:threonine aldolase
MANLVSVLTHAQRGDEIIVGDRCHIFRSEAGGASETATLSTHATPLATAHAQAPAPVTMTVLPSNSIFIHWLQFTLKLGQFF